jgi:hypothetical protein
MPCSNTGAVNAYDVAVFEMDFLRGEAGWRGLYNDPLLRVGCFRIIGYYASATFTSNNQNGGDGCKSSD